MSDVFVDVPISDQETIRVSLTRERDLQSMHVAQLRTVRLLITELAHDVGWLADVADYLRDDFMGR